MQESSLSKALALSYDGKEKEAIQVYTGGYGKFPNLYSAVLGLQDVESLLKLCKKTAQKDLIKNQIYQPSTPTVKNINNKNGLASCFFFVAEDNMESLGSIQLKCLQASVSGGGVGVDVSNIRSAGSITSGGIVSSGPVLFLKSIETSIGFANQGNVRLGGGVGYLSIYHLDFLSFISCKKENVDENSRLKTLSIGAAIPDVFWNACIEDEVFYQFCPHEVLMHIGKKFQELTEEDYVVLCGLADRGKIKSKKTSAFDLHLEIAKLQAESGYPYILNIDVTNRAHNIPGTVYTSNLCTEILQRGDETICNLGSINIDHLISKPITVDTNYSKLEYITKAMEESFKICTNTALLNINKNLPIFKVSSLDNLVKKDCPVGLGLFGLHDLFAKFDLGYGDDQSKLLTEVIFFLLNCSTLKASADLAKEHKKVFGGFHESEYAKDNYWGDIFDRIAEKIPRGSNLFEALNQILVETERQVKDNGLFNSYRTCIAPTGTISYRHNSSPSIQPINELIEKRQNDMGTFLIKTKHDPSKYKTFTELRPQEILDIYEIANFYIDQGVSFTYNFDVDKFSINKLQSIHIGAWKRKIKTQYYTRLIKIEDDYLSIKKTQQHLTPQECEMCMA